MCLTHKNNQAGGGIPGSTLYSGPLGLRFVCTSRPQANPQHLPGSSPVHPQVVPGPVLVSACLAGRACRFDGGANRDDEVARLVAEGRAVLVCPEVDGGLGTPRPPAEIVPAPGVDRPVGGADVWAGDARVVTPDGTDVTDAYVGGAQRALAAARRTGATRAVLKARSPSCGAGSIYDGTFTRTLIAGDGVTAALLRREGIDVVTEEDVDAGSTE